VSVRTASSAMTCSSFSNPQTSFLVSFKDQQIGLRGCGSKAEGHIGACGLVMETYGGESSSILSGLWIGVLLWPLAARIVARQIYVLRGQKQLGRFQAMGAGGGTLSRVPERDVSLYAIFYGRSLVERERGIVL